MDRGHNDYETDHELSALHELLVDDLARIVLPGLDVYRLLDDGICSAAKRPSGTVLSCYLYDQPGVFTANE